MVALVAKNLQQKNTEGDYKSALMYFSTVHGRLPIHGSSGMHHSKVRITMKIELLVHISIWNVNWP